MNAQEFRELLKRAKVDALHNMPDAQVGECLRGFLQEFDSGPEAIDFDRLMSSGILLARANKEDMDLPALRWFFERPSVRRLDIVSAFLNGVWKRNYRANPVPPDRIAMLLQARERTDTQADAEYSFVQALSQVMQPGLMPQMKSSIEQVFQHVSASKFGSPLDSLIRSVIEKAIQRSR